MLQAAIHWAPINRQYAGVGRVANETSANARLTAPRSRRVTNRGVARLKDRDRCNAKSREPRVDRCRLYGRVRTRTRSSTAAHRRDHTQELPAQAPISLHLAIPLTPNPHHP